MHFIWWLVSGAFIFWIYAIPYKIPGKRAKKDSPLDMLKMRFASGQITKEEFEENKKIME
jgi:putative membrane protein